MIYEFFARTDRGRVRNNNEDSVAFDRDAQIAVLADGMGGYNAGEVASAMATELLASRLLGQASDDCLRDSIDEANAEIYFAAQSEPGCHGMGTTLAVAWFANDRLTTAHIGDSRVYRLRGDGLDRLTRDHSVLQEALDSGIISAEEARFYPDKHLITRALGIDFAVDSEIQEFPVLAGDTYLLCSDGLSDMVDDEEIGQVLLQRRNDPALAADELVQVANENGGRDNVSVVVVKVRDDLVVRTGRWRKLVTRFS